MKAYIPRAVDRRLLDLLTYNGAVIIEGPRACGKTRTALEHAASSVLLDSDEAAQIAQVDSSLLLAGERPRLLDEWQLMPHLWNKVRRAIDAAGEPGQFILTGSSVPSDDITRHSGAGRMFRLRQRTMTWDERGLSDKRVSFAALVEGKDVDNSADSADLGQVLENLCVSGFPSQIAFTPRQSRDVLLAYAREISHTDVRELAPLRHSPDVVMALLKALARASASDTTFVTLAKDVRAQTGPITPETVARYVELLSRLYVVESIPPWTGKLRSRANLRRAPKYNLADPALAAALLGAGADMDLATAGVLFESAVAHDIAVYAEAIGGEASHFRDSNGNEIDLIVTLPDGSWGGIEVKLGGAVARDAADNLLRVSRTVEQPPRFLAVITGTGMTLQWDGVCTFPLSALTL